MVVPDLISDQNGHNFYTNSKYIHTEIVVNIFYS